MPSKSFVTANERERMYQLCALIEAENDHARFLRLIRELNQLLERKEVSLKPERESGK